MAVLKNRAKMSTSSTGTGTITLGSANTGYQSFADAGVANGDVVRYVIEDGNNWEIGLGAYTSSGTTLSRTVSESSNSGAALNLSGSATVFITAAAEDLPNLYADNPVSAVAPTASGNNAVAIGEESTASGTDSISLGSDSDATQTESSALGKFAQATGSGSVSLGARSVASGQFSVALGGYTDATSANAIAIGYAAQAVTGSGATAIGNSYASGANSFAAVITNNTSSYGATGAKGLAIGELAKATATNSIAIGDAATSTTANQIALGGTTDTVKISGAYTLPTADGSANQVLTTNGSGVVTFADAGGGASVSDDLYIANPSSATNPTAAGTNAVAIGSGAVAATNESIALGLNATVGTSTRGTALGFSANATGSQATAISDSVASGGNSFAAVADATASGTDSIALGRAATASSTYATAIGKNSSDQGSVATSGTAAMALGGSYSAGADSFAAGISNNTSSYGATGNYSVAVGRRAKATGGSAVALNYQAIASGYGSVSTGQSGNASASYSTVIGGRYGEANEKSKVTFGGSNWLNDGGTVNLAHQTGLFNLAGFTTDATAKALTTYDSTASGDNQVILPNNSAFTFTGTIIAREKASEGSDYSSWEIKGALLRDANAGSTVLGNGIVNSLYHTSGASAWAIALSADTTNGGLKVQVTGAASTNIRWAATVNTSEVIYA